MSARHPKTTPPLWEMFDPQTPEQLLGLMAEECWSRTEGPCFDARIVEAELAHVRAGGSWRTYLALESLYRDAATAQGSQSAVFGFFLGTTAPAILATAVGDDIEPWFDRAMRLAGLVPISAEVRTECEARRDRAMDERQLLQKQNTQTEGA